MIDVNEPPAHPGEVWRSIVWLDTYTAHVACVTRLPVDRTDWKYRAARAASQRRVAAGCDVSPTEIARANGTDEWEEPRAWLWGERGGDSGIFAWLVAAVDEPAHVFLAWALHLERAWARELERHDRLVPAYLP